MALLAASVSSVSADAVGTLDLDAHRGKVVVVDFWASWCVPGRRSFPWMNEMQSRYGNVLDASYRYMTDGWEIDSHTVDLRYRWPLGDGSYLEPHVRYYTQSHAEFYRTGLDGSLPLPGYALADYRLGEFDAVTLGVKYGRVTSSGNEWSARVELYPADGSVPANLLIGNQTSREIYPDLEAIILQFSYSFDW